MKTVFKKLGVSTVTQPVTLVGTLYSNSNPLFQLATDDGVSAASETGPSLTPRLSSQALKSR